MHEVMNEQRFERSADMVLYVDCPSLEGLNIPENVAVAGVKFRNVIVVLLAFICRSSMAKGARTRSNGLRRRSRNL
jgi:hypothetical protein